MFFRPVYSHKQFLPVFGSGTNYGLLGPTGATNYFSTPDSTVFNAFRASFTMTFCLAANDWTPSVPQWIFSHGLIGTNSVMNMALYPDGSLTYQASLNGIVDTVEAISSAVGFTNQTKGYIKVTRTSAGANQLKILKSDNGVDWTDITVSAVSAGSSLYNTNQPFILGGYQGQSANTFDGKIYSLVAGPGFEGPSSITLNFDPKYYDSGSTFITAPAGETWTINGSARILRRAGVAV